jgi:hypothetical protein
MMMAENYYNLDKIDAAEEYIKLSGLHIYDDSEEQKTGYKTIRSVIKKRNSTTPGVEKNLLEALKYYRSNSYQSETAQVSFHLADYYFKKEQFDKTLDYLTESLRLSSQNDYIPMYENKIPAHRELLDFAVSNNIHKDFIQNMFDRYFRKTEINWLSQKCKTRLLKQIEKSYDVKMLCFGEFEFTSRGKRIAEKMWTRKISKLILAYLILNPGIHINKDKAIDLFFPEVPMDKAEPLFHNAITNIRNTFSAVNGKSKSSPGEIIYENKLLRLNPDYYYISDVSEFNKFYELALVSQDTSAKHNYLTKAASLHRGDFLPGVNDKWCNELRNSLSAKYSEISDQISKLSHTI